LYFLARDPPVAPMPSTTTVPTRESDRALIVRSIVRTLFLGLLFLAAGRADWIRGWILAGLIVGSVAVNFGLMRWKNPSLIRARLEKHDNVEPFDRAFFAVSIPLGLLFLVVAGLDERFGWSSLPPGALWAGILLHVAGSIPIACAAVYNPFMELAVRLQDDRGQVTVSSGPYRFVRHPMYVGLILMFAGWPLVADSVWAYVPLGALAVGYVVRTALEDRTLRRHLPGYQDYCRLTRYRLLPGIW
jgi:protein-S-isoprenylcysteine O-methyltransferase Ste14